MNYIAENQMMTCLVLHKVQQLKELRVDPEK